MMSSGNHWSGDASGPPSRPGGAPDAGTPLYDTLAADLAAASGVVAGDAAGGVDKLSAGSRITIDPDTVEGAAILWLFSLIKQVEEADEERSWPGGDVVDQLLFWFAALGVNVEDDPATVATDLRDRFSTRLPTEHPPGTELQVRIRTPHPSARNYTRTYVSALVTALGPHSGAAVFDAAGDQIAHFAHFDPNPGP
jgi:hypothetical protein